jgi:serine/threonine protein kinase
MLSKIECSDEMLLGILNQDSGCSTELGLQHLDNCEHCQTRIEELAANQQQWTLAREGLCSRVEGGLDFADDSQNATRFHPTAEHSSEWTDTMAKQLLQPPSHPEMLGRLGRYEIERLVGSGGMGVVFKAYDSELHRSVAIKMLAPHLSGSRSARERFAREARAAAAIVNDHVVPIHNVETEHATPYLVMQYIAGHSLQARLDRDGPLDVCEILRIGMQVAIGLAAAHAQGLIHRDVKPSNIMLDENVARALLTDFGLARTQDEACLTRSGFHPGTPNYMSPEQVRGEELDGRSDLFSLGCVLYALCTGHPPYRADSGYAVMRRITDEQPRSIRDQNPLIPEWLERVVMRLLEKDREARFQSAEGLAQILEQCLAHLQKPATEPLPLAVVPKASFFDRVRIPTWILAGMASAFFFFAGVLIVLETNKGTITIKSEADNVPIRIKRSDQVVDEMVVSRTGKSVRLAAGEYVIEFDGDSQDLLVEGENVSLVRGETKTIQIAYRKSDGAEAQLSKGTQTRENYKKAIEESERLAAIAPNNAEYLRNLAAAYSKMGDLLLSEGNSTQAYGYAKKASEIRDRVASIATSAMSESTSTESDKRVLHAYNAISPEVDFSKPKATLSTVASDLASVVNDFNRVHTELLRSSNSRPLTVDELVASLWWQYSQSKVREEIRETVKEIVITRKLPPGWFIKLNSREWELPQQWWHEKPLSSSAIQINLIGKEGLATTIRNQFVSSDATSLQPPESPLKTAIVEFNESHSEEPDLTLDETLAALSTIWGKQSWYSSDGLKPSTMDALMAAIDRHVMKGVKIELLRTFETGDDRFSVWSIRLVVQNDQDGSTQAFTIRERFQKVNSFSDETIHWGKPSDAGLQAGFRFKPAQTRYLAGQVVDVEFFYRTIHGKGLAATLPNAFHFNKIEIELLRADEKQRLSVEHDRETIIGGWRVEGIGEQPTLFKNRKIRFVDSAEKLATAQQITDDWTTNVMLPINTKCDIAFDVPDFADDSKNSGSLLTGSAQFSVLNGSDEKRPPAILPVAEAIPSNTHESDLQSVLESVRLNFDQGLVTQDEVLTAEMNLVEAKIRTAEAGNVASLPALLKEREGILQRAFLNAKSKFEAGLIGIDEFSRFVADLIHAKFTSLIVAERLAESLDTVSPNDAR